MVQSTKLGIGGRDNSFLSSHLEILSSAMMVIYSFFLLVDF